MAHPTAPAVIAAVACAAALLGTPAFAADPGRTLAQRQGCLGCHAVDAPLVGPAYRAVAERYAGQADALATLTRHVREGSSGRWGQMPMPPQTQLSEAQARQLATWILAGAK